MILQPKHEKDDEYTKRYSTMISAVGHLDIRAGVRFWLAIPELSGTKQVTAKKVSHKFGQNWLMTVEVEV